MGSSGGRAAGQTTIASDHNLVAWSTPMSVARDVSLLSVEAAAGTLRLSRIRRVPTASITNVLIYVTTGGSSLTSGQCFAALYTSAGALIGQSADQATAWQSSGIKTMALAGGPYSFAGGDCYVGLWYNGTTAPTLLRAGVGSSGAQMNVGQSSSEYDCMYADTGLTTTAPSSIGAKTSSALYWWAGLS